MTDRDTTPAAAASGQSPTKTPAANQPATQATEPGTARRTEPDAEEARPMAEDPDDAYEEERLQDFLADRWGRNQLAAKLRS
jgi:hypothetical protein